MFRSSDHFLVPCFTLFFFNQYNDLCRMKLWKLQIDIKIKPAWFVFKSGLFAQTRILSLQYTVTSYQSLGPVFTMTQYWLDCSFTANPRVVFIVIMDEKSWQMQLSSLQHPIFPSKTVSPKAKVVRYVIIPRGDWDYFKGIPFLNFLSSHFYVLSNQRSLL